LVVERDHRGYSVGTYLTTKWVFILRKRTPLLVHATSVGYRPQLIVTDRCKTGATSLMYEGAPNCPSLTVSGGIIDRHKVNVFYTAPTRFDLLEVGRPVAQETQARQLTPARQQWVADQSRGVDVVSRSHRPQPLSNRRHWWQTETGHIMLSPIPGAIATKPGSATRPFLRGSGDRHDGWQTCARGLRRFPRSKAALAWHAATIYGDPDR